MVERFVEFFSSFFIYWFWFIPPFLNGLFLYRLIRPFITLREKWWAKALLFTLLYGSSAMVIWVGDNNLLFTLLVFLPCFLLCTKGELLGRLTLSLIFFCIIMSVCAILDTYLSFAEHYDQVVRLCRPLVFGLLYFGFRRNLPDKPLRLSNKLWQLMFGLSLMPLASLIAVILLTYARYYSQTVDIISRNQGLLVLPVVLINSLVLLLAVIKLTDYEHLQQANSLAAMREVYYQGLQREQTQVRTLRHDLRNHLAVLHGLIDSGDTAKALDYLEQTMGSPAMQGRRQLCANETANAVLAAKAERIEQLGLAGDFQISLPPQLAMEDTDLCALLGNALDNAIEAAVKAEDKRVRLRCRVDKGMLMLKVTNALAGDERADLGTTKADKENHGFGLTGMREIAARYGGSLEAGARDGMFELIACIPI